MRRLSAATLKRNANISMEYGCIKDPNIYCYRMNKETGEMKLKGIILGRGWEVWPLDYTALSCYAQGEEGEDTVVNKKEPPGKEELLALWVKHEGKIDRIRQEYKTGWNTARRWLIEVGIIDDDGNFIEQTPNPDPAQAANQEPDQGEKESAPTSISRGCPFDEPVNMPLGCELPPEPERLSYTSSQYQEQVNGPEVNAAPDINGTKIQLIATVLAEYRDDKISADLTMKLVGKIKDMEVA